MITDRLTGIQNYLRGYKNRAEWICYQSYQGGWIIYDRSIDCDIYHCDTLDEVQTMGNGLEIPQAEI
jgi:hypothetical protein